MKKDSVASSSTAFSSFYSSKTSGVSIHRLDFDLRKGRATFYFMFDKEKVVCQGKWYPGVWCVSSNVFTVVQLFWNPSGYFFFNNKRSKRCHSGLGQTEFSSSESDLNLLLLQLSSMHGHGEDQRQLSRIVVLETS